MLLFDLINDETTDNDEGVVWSDGTVSVNWEIALWFESTLGLVEWADRNDSRVVTHHDELEMHRLEHSNTILTTHAIDKCADELCCIHNRSDHRMRDRPQHWRDDRGIMERICEHGVGHPDIDSPWDTASSLWVHGCDGCCGVVIPEP